MTLDFVMTVMLTTVFLTGYAIGRVDAFQKGPWAAFSRRK